MVEESRARNHFVRIRSRIHQSLSASTSESADQSCAADAKRFSGNWKLDGRRNSLARESFAVEANSKINGPPSRRTFPRNKIRRAPSTRNTWKRLLRSATEMANSPEMEG